MGNCIGTDVSNKYAAGGDAEGNSVYAKQSQKDEAQAAVSLLNGSLAYSTWIELMISCQHLVSKDALSKSDPMAVLYAKVDGKWQEAGRTEFATNDHNPVFVKRFRILFNFEKVQEMKAYIVDVDSRQDPAKIDPNKCDFLGMAEFKISQVLTAEDKTIQLPLSKGEKSTVTIKGEECGSAREVFTFGVSASALNNVELLSKSDPFLEICRQHDDGKWLPIYKTEVIDNNLNPSWRPIRVKASQLTHGEPKRPLKLRVYDFESNGRHKLIGQATIDSVILQKASSENQPILLTSHDKPAGQLHVRDFQIEVEPTFIDYFQGGIEMKFVVAIDFTGSNGPPTHPQSLHYINPNGAQTHYEKAITGVGRVIEAYDSDRNFPVWGFGGQRPPQTTQHCFPVGDDPNGICVGVDGILEAYRKSLFQWNLAGPTLFNPIIEAASRIAAQPADHIKYMVLLILTDGEIMDMRESVRAIIAASKLPMSILIVGVGSSPELVNMEVLDSDKVKLESNGNIAERDIVQFVQFNKFQNDGNALANELLAELPGQFLAYMKTNKIPVPMPPPAPEFAKGTAAVESTISL